MDGVDGVDEGDLNPTIATYVPRFSKKKNSSKARLIQLSQVEPAFRSFGKKMFFEMPKKSLMMYVRIGK